MPFRVHDSVAFTSQGRQSHKKYIYYGKLPNRILNGLLKSVVKSLSQDSHNRTTTLFAYKNCFIHFNQKKYFLLS